jgi:O-antigen/teichoic acid export membrane protein
MSGARSALRDKFSRDVLWNVVSLGVAGVCGLAVNYIVGQIYGASGLGVFNQVFAVYIVASQLAILGLQSSVLAHVAVDRPADELRAIVTTGFVLAGLSALAVTGLFVATAGPMARWLESPDVAVGILWAAPGLVCFTFNKIILATLNGLRRMRPYAVFQGGRVVLMGVGLAACGIAGAPRTALPVILTIAEASTLLLSIGTIVPHLGRVPRAALVDWIKKHTRYAVRGAASGLFTELNNRIDVIILGRFVSDASVGAYSMAQLAAEGVSQLLVALRINYAPVIVRLHAAGDKAEITRVVRQGKRRVYLGALVVGVLAVAGYALVMNVFSRDPVLAHSWIFFAIILGGWVVSAGYVPFNQMLLWTHLPGWHTVLVALIVLSSVVADVVLSSRFGALGASCATALTCATAALFWRAFVKKLLDLRL